MSTDPTVQGHVETGFEKVREQFAANLAGAGEVGASLGVYVDGRLVVDLWGGDATPGGRAWERDTVATAYSVTKGATALLVHRLAQDGALDLDAPVARYWPEFAAAGKAEVTVTQLLSHQAGLPALDSTLDLEQLLGTSTAAEALAAQAPLWEPGTDHGYHALTFGWLVGELVRRACGRSLGEVFDEVVARPLGLDDRVADLVDGVPDPSEIEQVTDPDARAALMAFIGQISDPGSLFSRVLSTNGALPTPSAATWNDPAVRAAEQPAAGGVTNGRSVARLYAAAIGEVDGVRLLSPETLERARAEQVRGPDRVLMTESRFATGFQLPVDTAPLLGAASFGHVGAGGALGFADTDRGVGFGYVPNLLGASMLGDPRTPALIAALDQSLRATGGAR